jgi:hypothetical protein
MARGGRKSIGHGVNFEAKGTISDWWVEFSRKQRQDSRCFELLKLL